MLTQLYRLKKDGFEELRVMDDLTLEDAWEAMFDERLKPLDSKVLAVLADFHFKNDGEVYPSLSTIQKKVNCTKPTLRKSLTKLNELGFVKWVERGDMQQHLTHKYFIDIPKRKNKKFLPPRKNLYGVGKKFTQNSKKHKKFTLITPSNYNLLYLIKPKGFINIYNTLKENPKIGKLKGRRVMKQNGLFSGAPTPKKKKRNMSEEELYERAKTGEVKLNRNEFVKVYNYLHKQVYNKMCSGKLTHQGVEDLRNTYNDLGVTEETFWKVLPEVFKQYKENTTAPHVSLWMLMGQKEAKEYIANALEGMDNDFKAYDEAGKTPGKGYQGKSRNIVDIEF